MLVADPTIEMIDRAISQSIDNRELARGFRAAMDVLRRVPEARQLKRGLVLQGLEAERYLVACIRAVEAHARASARGGYGVYRWLWYLRRCPERVFTGLDQSDIADAVRWNSLGYAWALSEVLATLDAPPLSDRVEETESVAATGDVQQVLRPEFALTFPIDASIARRIVRHCALSTVVASLHVTRRWSAKGAPIRFDNSPLPTVVPEKGLRQAVAIYDERIAERTSWPDRLGIMPDLAFHGAPGPILLYLAGIRGRRSLPILVPEEAELLGQQLEVQAQYLPQFMQLSGLGRLMTEPHLADPGLWDPNLPALLSLHSLALALYRRGQLTRANLMRLGYAVYPRTFIREECEPWWEEFTAELAGAFPLFAGNFPASPDALIEQCLAISGEPWPLKSGPVLFVAGTDRVGINLYSASNRLFTALEFPVVGGNAQGDVARIRGGAFEATMQSAIDRTPWRPVDRGLIARTLRLGGSAIGDIDALAVMGNRWILVSCKSQVYTAAYDAGDYNIVRNVADRVEQFVIEWDDFIGELRGNPVGDNYDLSGRELVGIVVTPRPMFVRMPLVSRNGLPGLRTYSSAEELIHWLERTV